MILGYNNINEGPKGPRKVNMEKLTIRHAIQRIFNKKVGGEVTYNIMQCYPLMHDIASLLQDEVAAMGYQDMGARYYHFYEKINHSEPDDEIDGFSYYIISRAMCRKELKDYIAEEYLGQEVTV